MVNVKVIEGTDPPSGYSFLTYGDTPMIPMQWYARAVKVSRVRGTPLADFVITHQKGSAGDKYVLWVKKHKNGKMVGKGFGGKK